MSQPPGLPPTPPDPGSTPPGPAGPNPAPGAWVPPGAPPAYVPPSAPPVYPAGGYNPGGYAPPGGGYPPAPPYPAPGTGVYTPGATNGLAVGALVVSLVSLFFCWIGGIAGALMGSAAKRQIRASGGMEGGEGLATAAQVIGWLQVGLLVVLVFIILGLISTRSGFRSHPFYSQPHSQSIQGGFNN